MIKVILYISDLCIKYLESVCSKIEEDNTLKQALMTKRDELRENVKRIKNLINEHHS